MIDVLASGAVAVGGWAALRVVRLMDSLHDKVDGNSERLASIEGRLTNGFSSELKAVHGGFRDLKVEVKEFRGEFKEHADGEEARIMQWCEEHRR